MPHRIRYQGAILQDDQILLICHREHASGREYWIFPGGGIEPGESEIECVRREMREETGLDVQVGKLLLDEAVPFMDRIHHHKTYHCKVISGAPAPGYEPEPEASSNYSIHALAWYDLRDPLSWGEVVRRDPVTFPLLLALRRILGYEDGS